MEINGWPEVREVLVRTVPVHGVPVRTTVSQRRIFLKIFLDFSQPYLGWFSLRFLVSETSHTSMDHTRMPPWAHSFTLTLCAYMFWLSDRSPRKMGTVTPQYVQPVTSPVSHLTHHTTFCTEHTVHSVCSLYTIVINPLLTTFTIQLRPCWATGLQDVRYSRLTLTCFPGTNFMDL